MFDFVFILVMSYIFDSNLTIYKFFFFYILHNILDLIFCDIVKYEGI